MRTDFIFICSVIYLITMWLKYTDGNFTHIHGLENFLLLFSTYDENLII